MNAAYRKWKRMLRVKFAHIDRKKAASAVLPPVLSFWLFSLLENLYTTASGSGLDRLFEVVLRLGEIAEHPFPALHFRGLSIGICGAVGVQLLLCFKRRTRKNYRKGVEYGSARWGTPRDIKPFMDPDPANNIIITETEQLSMSSRMENPEHNRNKNMLVIGSSGSGKTRFLLKPNLMQCHSSYVVTDPKGSLLTECGYMLQRRGYRIKVLNLIDFRSSMHYNPFHYIHSEEDILKLVDYLIENTKGAGEKSSDDFWLKAEKLYYTALIGYIWYEAPEEEKNFTTLLEMLDASEVHEDDEMFRNAVDMAFDELAERDPGHFAVRQYHKYKLAAGKTAKSILVSCGARLAPFDIREVRELMEYDELELDTLGDRKTALFVIVSDSSRTFNFISAMAYSQMFNCLLTKADVQYHGRLPVHVRCLFDEFANIGKIPNFETLISTIRSREISACIILQALSQLKSAYKDNADTIMGCCDSILFLGGTEPSTLKWLSETLGKETIDTTTSTDTRGTSRSMGTNFQKLGRQLFAVDELSAMPRSECIYQLSGVRPFRSKKYDLKKHPNYRLLSDADPKNAFDAARYLDTGLKVRDSDKWLLLPPAADESLNGKGK